MNLKEDGGKHNAKICGGLAKECCKAVERIDVVLMTKKGSDGNVCIICKRGGSGMLMWVTVVLFIFSSFDTGTQYRNFKVLC